MLFRSHAYLRAGGRQTGLAHYGVGKRYETFPEDVGMLFPAGEANVTWNLHYFPVGTSVPQDVVDVGVWFYPEGETPRVETRGEGRLRADRSGGGRWGKGGGCEKEGNRSIWKKRGES